MTVDEIFSRLSAHMIRGMMIHEQMCNYYGFLGLHGFKRLHEYHYLCETVAHRKLQRFFLNRYNKLIPDSEVDSSSIIPQNWYKYTRDEVDSATRRNAVEAGVKKWVEWEREVRDLYTNYCIELDGMGEVSAANYLRDLIKDNDKEIKCAEREHLLLASTNYDATFIAERQQHFHEKYKKKAGEILPI